MLLSLHVRNLALIEEEEVSFTDGLNILTGETGAGKSIIIGSVNLALGARADKSLIRTGCEYALIEMCFRLDNARQAEILRQMDLPSPEEDGGFGTILVKRKIYPNRSVCTVDGETVTLRQLRDISGLLIDVYGQRENQRLLRREAQLGVLDDFAGEEAARCIQQLHDAYRTWREYQRRWDADDSDENARIREQDLLAYEVKEIEDAALQDGEDEQLETQYRLLSNYRRISESCAHALALFDEDDGSASAQISRALRDLSENSGLDPRLDSVTSQLLDIDSLMSDLERSLHDYTDSLSFDPQEFAQIEERLNLINHLKDKYGSSIADIRKAAEGKQKRLDELADYDGMRSRLQRQIEESHQHLMQLCSQMSAIRQKAAGIFTRKMVEQLKDLNFEQVVFDVDIDPQPDQIGPDGYDRVSFNISMNPGESPRPLENIASGGELSRIMLAMKTVFAGQDDIHTFIFDEIDSGISGVTAWKVAQKLANLAQDHQILCITHLPQIAAMEDSHYLIEKTSTDDSTSTHIHPLDEEGSCAELARMLGSGEKSAAALQNARDLKARAMKVKTGIRA